jgi:hypothetical protein
MSKWLVFVIIILFSTHSFAQDNKPINNKGKIKQMRAKSVKKKEKASTKDIAGKRLRTKNANSAAGRAIYSNPSPYANERKGKDRVAKPVGGQPLRIRSKSAESARNNVYPQSGPFFNRGSTKSETGRSNRSKGSLNSPRSKSRSAETSRANAYPQKGPFVNQSSRQTERPGSKSQGTRRGRLSTNARTSKSIRVSSPRSSSSSAESSKGKRFQQTGAYVNRSSKTKETVSSSTNQYTRRSKLSAGPNPPGKKRIVTPRSASQQYVTRGRKDVYWGKFSKGEKAITTDVSGNPLRKKNYRTPPNEIIKPKDPYGGRKKSSGDRAYAGTFRSGYTSVSKRSEKAWIGDVSGQPIRQRSSKRTEVAGRRSPGQAKAGGSISASGKYRSNQPFIGGGGSMSGSGKYRSNKSLNGREGSLSVSNKNRSNVYVPKGGGSISGSPKYRTNKPLNSRAGSLSVSGQNRSNAFIPKGGGSISASGNYRSNKPFKSRTGTLSVSGQNRTYDLKRGGGGSISGKVWNNNSQPIITKAPGIGATGMARVQSKRNSKQPMKVFSSDMEANFQGDIKARNPEKGGGSVSGKLWNNNNRPIMAKAPGIGATGMARVQRKRNSKQPMKVFSSDMEANFQGDIKTRNPEKGGGSVSGKLWNNNNRPIAVKTPGIGATALARYQKKTNSNEPTKIFSSDLEANFQGNIKTKEPKKGGGSISGKLWNNNGQPIAVRTPTGAQASAVGYSGRIKLPTFKRAYVRNPNAVEKALKKESPYETVYMADGLQVTVKAKQTGTKPKAVKGSLPGLAPSRATVKASEYSRSVKIYWSYKHNPSSADESQKTIAPTKNFNRASAFSGRTRLTKNYIHNPMSDKEALKVIAPGRAYARITDYQGNIKMGKYKDKRFLPDAQFAHGNQNNVKQERTMMTDFKLLWTKIFKKNGTQPTAVKEKPVRPRYDKRERELWPGLYD